ncbi:unnamed protein product [Adineta ricciae]|uniref:Uncharacterized protein n=1 Tax=Adineta ricciae TaxID=249248 RepID=A0A814MH89_ADIRI|nr:unnamed protein product [Adineta ricciae]CAF1668284.1 unnamed protein product [Adineta ricciae]
MQRIVLLLLTFMGAASGLFYGTTDLPDGDAEMFCSTEAGFDIGRDLPEELTWNYSQIPKGQWFRMHGQIRRTSYDAPDSVLRRDDPQRQGNCYFQIESNAMTEYIQNIPFPRATAMSTPYNYYFSASMFDDTGRVRIALEWYDEQNRLLNSTSIHSNNRIDTANVSRLNEAKLGKIVQDAKTMLIRIKTDPLVSKSESMSYSIDMIHVVFFPDHIFGNGRPSK